MTSPSPLPTTPVFPFPSPQTVPQNLLSPNAPGGLELQGIKRYRRLEIDPERLLAQVRHLDKGTVLLDLGGGYRWDLELERVSVRAPGYRVRLLTPQGLRDIEPGPELRFRGRIRGNAESRVRLSMADGRVTGFIDAGDGDRTFLEPLDLIDPRQSGAAHALYRQSDLQMPPGAVCGGEPGAGFQPPGQGNMPVPGAGSIRIPYPRSTGPSAPGDAGNGGLAKAGAAAATEPCALVEIGVAAEYSMVVGYGGNAAVEKRINDIFNMVEGLYEDPRINIHIRITELIIESGPNQTWGPMNIGSYLSNLPPWARGSQGFKGPYDVADLWYYDPLVSTGTTGLANVATVCNKTSGGHVIRDFTRTASFLMINQAHELAHNFGANHVNNPKAILNPMILGDNTTWDDTTIAAILTHKHSRVCLSTCNQGPTAEFLVAGDSPCSDVQRFTDASRGDPTSWLWTFGDGEGSTEKNPAHRYAKAGVYTARLTAANPAGADTVSVGGIKVKPYAAPSVTGAASCTPAALTLKADGSGTLKWYDVPAGGAKLGEGASFRTPALAASKAYYVESGDPDFPIRRLGPASNAIGAGQYFVSNSDRRLYFDVARPALIKTAKVYASAAGPRTIEVLDQSDARVATRTVQVPAGESRVTLDFELPPGHDYAVKYAGNPDSLNLFRNSAGAAFPYRSADSLIVITRSDATSSDSASQSGYYYYFYDWEIQERGCASVRVPVAALISCDPIATLPGSVAPALRRIGAGLFRYAGESAASGVVEFRLRTLDGRDLRRKSERVRPGAFAVDLDLAGLPANLYLLEVRHAGVRTLEKVIGF
jgi:hypothetical protein